MKRWILAFLFVLLWQHRGGWWHGGVYLEEDVAAHFFVSKGRLYQLVQGLEPWSQWDPLAGLGSPRLANIQVGWFSPLSLWFALLPPLVAWQFYPLFTGLLLGAAAAWAARETGIRSWAAAFWVAITWGQCQCILAEAQHPPYLESMIAALFSLAAALGYWRRGGLSSLVLLLAGGYLHIASGSPSAMFFNHACLTVLLPYFVWTCAPSRRRFALSLAAYLSGCLLAFPALAPLREYHQHSHRALPGVAGREFSNTYSYSAGEVLRRVASESLLGAPVLSATTGGYALPRDVSLAVTLLGLSGLGVARLRWLTLASVFLLLQSLGEAGGGVWLLHQVVPGTLSVRGSGHFFLLGLWGLVLAAAMAWQHWRAQSGLRARLADGLAAFGASFALLAHPVAYYPKTAAQAPPLPPSPGSLGVLLASRPAPPLLWASLPMLAGRRCLLAPQEPYEGGFLLGLACSQFGERGPELLRQSVLSGRQIPLKNPSAPLLRAWGLSWVLEGAGSEFRWRNLQPQPAPYCWWALPSSLPASRWASQESPSPFASAVVEGAGPAQPAVHGKLFPALMSPDEQRIQVEGSGLLVVADQWDPGWDCQIDGRSVEVLRVNFALKGCWVPPGSREVHWTYRTRWWRRALLLHMAGWLGAIATLVAARLLPGSAPRRAKEATRS